MTDALPIACSLNAGELRERLDQIAAIGAERLTGRRSEDGRHLLRFRPDPSIRRRLEEIVAAESECCSFLDLDLREEGQQLVLEIAAPADAEPVAEELALAFERGRG